MSSGGSSGGKRIGVARVPAPVESDNVLPAGRGARCGQSAQGPNTSVVTSKKWLCLICSVFIGPVRKMP